MLTLSDLGSRGPGERQRLGTVLHTRVARQQGAVIYNSVLGRDRSRVDPEARLGAWVSPGSLAGAGGSLEHILNTPHALCLHC